MAKTSYYTVDGEILGERTAGVRRNYGVDALGSVTATIQGSALENKYAYKPYGEQLQKSGSGPDTNFMWVGTRGYLASDRTLPDFYVRARHYSSTSYRWVTSDPFWPTEPRYDYCGNNPTTLLDPDGEKARNDFNVKIVDCDDKIISAVKDVCRNFQFPWDPARLREVNKCISGLSRKHGATCNPLNASKLSCLKSFCDSGYVRCDNYCEIEEHGCGYTPDFPGGQTSNSNPRRPFSGIVLCANNFGLGLCGSKTLSWLGDTETTVLHEALHACGTAHGVNHLGDPMPMAWTCNELILACVLGAGVAR